MPTPQGHNFDSLEEAEEYHKQWPRLKCNYCGIEYITHANEAMSPCVHCSVPRRDGRGYAPKGIMERVPLKVSDPYLFEPAAVGG